MSNMDYFWLGFTVCFIMVGIFGMILVYITALAEAAMKLRKAKRIKENT